MFRKEENGSKNKISHGSVKKRSGAEPRVSAIPENIYHKNLVNWLSTKFPENNPTLQN